MPDSGGAGRWRGGLSLQREYELLEDATVIRRYDKSRFPPNGLAGGSPGRAARFVIKLGTDRGICDAVIGPLRAKGGRTLLLQSAGGGGYGEPSTRDRAALERDIAEGYVSAEAAKRDYGR